VQTDYRLDLKSFAQHVVANVTALDALPPAFVLTLDMAFSHVAELVNAQGFSVQERDASLVVTPASQGDPRMRTYELTCRNLHSSVWRVLAGLLHTFDVASMPLESIRFDGGGQSVADSEILALAYPGVRGDSGLQVERDTGQGMDRSVEIEFVSGVSKATRQAIDSGMAAWLDLCEGGFFLDGEQPVTAAHDCPGFEAVGNHLLVARFEYFAVSESAIDVLLNALDHWHRQSGAILSVRIY
jgi:hypothetical protein